jgi:mRNA interferase MazF
VKRGEIYEIDLTYGRSGHEQQGKRPAIILSNDVFNSKASWGTVTVVPVSTSSSQAQRQYGVPLSTGVGGLPSASIALCHQITTIDRNRIDLSKCYGQLDAATIKRVSAEVKIILYLL